MGTRRHGTDETRDASTGGGTAGGRSPVRVGVAALLAACGGGGGGGDEAKPAGEASSSARPPARWRP